MPLDPKRVQTAFLAAVEHHDPAARAGILDRECSADGELRQRVEAMLNAHDQFHTLHNEPLSDFRRAMAPLTGTEGEGPEYTVAALPADVTADLTPPPRDATIASGTVDPRRASATAEGPGTCIGPYKLLQRIGQGGMGVVYMAQQEQPVRRRVALKIIKPGMDSEQVIGRFRAERQALAMMDHPSIARVYDAGTTDSGRPYFVMELVQGIPITEYCDQVRLTPRERLQLFIEVCQAIQHAHQKGIIHRDIKPSNILVTLCDGQPVPKVIDFGVAKATDQRLTEQTIFTQYGTIVGTLEYMSPEQAEFSPMGVDTRSDVYALGVVLYELLTGSTPLERTRLSGAGYAEILEWIKEKQPPKPSTRLSSSGERLGMLSGQRSTEPARLTKLMRGELDWIVMKALEKDRTRRYETASSFARDVRHFLDGDPVEACPPSASYRLGKFARKHRAALATVSGFAALLVVGAVVSTWQAIVATRAEVRATREARHALEAKAQATAEGQRARRSAAEAEAVLSFFQDQVLAAPRPEGQDGGLGRDVTLRQAVDAAEPKIAAAFPDQPGVEAAVRHTLGSSYSYLGQPAPAIRQLQRALELRTAHLGPDHPDTLTTQNALALACQAAGRWDRAIPLFEQTLAARTAQLGADHPSTLLTQNNLALAYQANGRWDRAIPLLEETLAARRAKLGANHPDTLATQNDLATAYQENGRWDRAIPLLEETLAARTVRLGANHPDTLTTQNNLASAYQENGRWDRAIPLLEETLAARRAKLGPDHPDTLTTQDILANGHKAAGRWDRAIPLLEETLAARTARLGSDHTSTLTSQNNLALTYRDAGQWDRAILLLERTLAAETDRLGADHPNTLLTQNNLALTYRDDGQWDRAITLFERTLAIRRAKLGPDHPDTLLTQQNLAMAYREAGRWDQAIPLFERTLAAQKARLGTDHPYTLLAQQNLAPAYQAVGQIDRAIALLEQTLAARTAKLGADHPSTFATQNNLALAYQAAGQIDRAITLFERTLAARTARVGDDHPRTLTTQYDLACAHQARGDSARAEVMLRAVLAARKKKLGGAHPEVGRTLAALGQSLLKQGRWSTAEAMLREGLAILEAKRPDDWLRSDTQVWLGASLLAQKKYTEAEPLLRAGYEGLKAREARIPVPSRYRLAEAGDRLVQLYEAWDRHEKAREWRQKLAPSTAAAKK